MSHCAPSCTSNETSLDAVNYQRMPRYFRLIKTMGQLQRLEERELRMIKED